MENSAIFATQLSKQVQTQQERLTILEDVELNVQRGEKVAFIGVSGAGKSTLLKLLAGLDTPSNGEIKLLGQSLAELDDAALSIFRNQHIGFIFQDFLLIPSLNALDNVMLPKMFQPQQQSFADIQQEAEQKLAEVGLAHRKTHMPNQLSGGEMQRVAIARAFMGKASILFADEPTGNLDPKNAENVADRLFQMNTAYQTTLVLVSHDHNLAKQCDSVYEVKDNGIQPIAL